MNTRWLAVAVISAMLSACALPVGPVQQPGELRIGLLATLSGSAADVAGFCR